MKMIKANYWCNIKLIFTVVCIGMEEKVIKLGETEFMDSEEVLEKKLSKLQSLIDESEYIVFYTGAGNHLIKFKG